MFIIKRLFKIIVPILMIFVLTGCGTINERLLINRDGSGSVRLSLTVDKESESQVTAYLDDYIPGQYEIKTVIDGFKINKMFFIEREFNDLSELGYDDSYAKIEVLDKTYIYTFFIRDFVESDELFSNEELRQFLVDEEIDLEFSITLMGYPLTKPVIKEGSYSKLSKTFLPASVTATWDAETVNQIELQAYLPPMITEWVCIFGLILGIAYFLMRYALVKKYGADITLFKFIQKEIVGEDEEED